MLTRSANSPLVGKCTKNVTWKKCTESSKENCARCHGSAGRAYWPMYITTSSLPGSASGSTKFRGLPHLPPEESVDRTVMKSPYGFPASHSKVLADYHGRMAQLVVPTGTISRMRDVDVNRLLASRSLESTEGSPKNPNILGEIVRIVRIRSHGSVGRTYWLMYITLLRLALSKRAQDKSESHSVLWLSW